MITPVVSPAPEEAPPPPLPAATPPPGDPSAWRAILRLALPLILGTTGHTLMQLLDGVFLARYSEDAIAISGPAGMTGFLFSSLFVGAAGYTATFVAQYRGAGRPERIGPAVWQGLFFSAAASLFVLATAIPAVPLFEWIGHAERLRLGEARFFQIVSLGSCAGIAGAAVSGFFIGLGRTRTLMAIQIGSQLLNAALAPLLIFGPGPFPELGALGAAVASSLAVTAATIGLLALFLGPAARAEFGTGSACRFDPDLFRRLMRFGFPNGLRFFVEMLGWTLFVLFVGRVGERELAATNIAWRINLLAFMPMIGLGTAISTLVGQAQGMGRPDLSARITWRGLAAVQAWMMALGAVFLFAPGPLVGIFAGAEREGAALASLAAVLLRYVAAYCLLDGFNVVFGSVLQGAGDTRFMLRLTLLLYAGFIGSLAWLDRARAGLHAEWTAATIFVMILALAWLLRFLSGRWRGMRVIEDGAE